MVLCPVCHRCSFWWYQNGIPSNSMRLSHLMPFWKHSVSIHFNWNHIMKCIWNSNNMVDLNNAPITKHSSCNRRFCGDFVVCTLACAFSICSECHEKFISSSTDKSIFPSGCIAEQNSEWIAAKLVSAVNTTTQRYRYFARMTNTKLQMLCECIQAETHHSQIHANGIGSLQCRYRTRHDEGILKNLMWAKRFVTTFNVINARGKRKQKFILKCSNIKRRQIPIEMWFECSQSSQRC